MASLSTLTVKLDTDKFIDDLHWLFGRVEASRAYWFDLWDREKWERAVSRAYFRLKAAQ